MTFKLQFTEAKSCNLPVIFAYIQRKKHQPPFPIFTVFEFSLRRVLSRCNIIW